MPLSPSPVTSDDHEGLIGNPWVESSAAPQIGTDPKEPTPEESAQTLPKLNGRTSHIRSYTTAGHPLGAVSPSDANERHDVSTRGTSLDLHETRPSLKRVINASISNTEGEASEDFKDGETVRRKSSETSIEAEAEVIIHQIQTTDSLPGVALKYNISVAALRSANKLWASDSIHLRQVLYIPVQAVATESTKPTPAAAQQRPGLRSSFLHTAPDFRALPLSHQRRSVSEWDTIAETPRSVAHTISAGTDSIIKRVPLSELSFFPPPSTSALSPPSRLSRYMPRTPPRPNPSRSTTSTSTLPPGSSASTSPFFSGTSGGSGNGVSALGLTSFLNGAKDELMSRLSLDSVRGSDTAEDPEVEMDIVRPITAPDQRSNDKMSDIRTWQRGTASLAGSDLEREGVVLNTPRKPKPIVRTMQLQPSPRMEIPVTASRADKAANGTGPSAMLMDSS